MGLKKTLKNFLIGKKGSYTGKTTSDLLVESLNSAGGGDIFVVKFTTDNENTEADKTYAECLQAYEAGKAIIFVYSSTCLTVRPHIMHDESGNNSYYEFIGQAMWEVNSAGMGVARFCMSPDAITRESVSCRFSQ